MVHRRVPQVGTSRLLLREAEADDLEAWAASIYADPEVVRYLPRREMTPLARAERTFARYTRLWAERPYGGWLVVDKVEGTLVGHCKLDYLPETDEVELGYALARRYWGRGLASEAARAATRFGFETAGLQRIMAVLLPENKASRRVLEKAGFVYEGNARYYDLDVAYYAISREQFSADGSFFAVRLPGGT